MAERQGTVASGCWSSELFRFGSKSRQCAVSGIMIGVGKREAGEREIDRQRERARERERAFTERFI